MWRYGRYGPFFLSGVSALIYELIWQRQLHLLFGVSTLAVSAVLGSYMGGLALGALAFGPIADRTYRPIRMYALLEAAIGVSAALVPFGFSLITSLYLALCARLHPGLWGGGLLRLAMSLCVLAVPTMLIGGTLPVMGRLVLRRADGATKGFGLFYSVNTLGAVLGAALTGFVLLRYVGMYASLCVGVGLNVAVALIAWMVGMRQPVESPRASLEAPPAPTPIRRTTAVLAMICAAGTGATTLGLEVVWTRILGVFTSNSAYAFALMLTSVLLGLGIGALLQAWMARREGDTWRRLALCQCLLIAVCLFSVPHLHTAPAWLDRLCDGQSALAVFGGEAALTVAVVLLPAILLGLGFPLLVDIALQNRNGLASCLGRVYATNTIACVLGAFAAGFVLIPWLGIQNTLGILLAIALAVGLIAWSQSRRPNLAWRGLVAASLVCGAVYYWRTLPAGGYQKSFGGNILSYREGNNGTVSVRQDDAGRRWLLVDLPLLLHPQPKRALTVGFGSGGTSYSMSLHGVDVDCVEIERAVSAMAPQFASENHDILANPRFRLLVDDARSWLRVAPAPYDAIVTDCTNLQYKSNGDLYTVEYFQLMKQRLSAEGLAAAWVPANGIDPRDLKTLLRSFREVFPHTSVWHSRKFTPIWRRSIWRTRADLSTRSSPAKRISTNTWALAL
jgi:spermidine synthase